MRFDRLNNMTGWAVWALATLVYFLTVEPTASFWDCGEFIASAYKLEVGHPPGAPFFMLLARFLMIPMGPETAALAANSLSVLSSSFTILFLFWSITHLAKRMSGEDEPQGGSMLAVLGSGVIGALGLHIQRFVLVQCGGGRSVCAFKLVHGPRVLGHFEMGKRCRPTRLGEVDHFDRLPDGAVHWGPLAQLAGHSCHRVGVFLSQPCIHMERLGGDGGRLPLRCWVLFKRP